MADSEIVYKIKGGNPIIGEINCLGAKNFSTKAMVAAVLADSPTTLSNVPNIGDIEITKEMLRSIGVGVHYEPELQTMEIDPRSISSFEVGFPQSVGNRIPILLLGALLHKNKEVSVPVLGGCKIGARPVDFHLQAIELFGGEVEYAPGGYIARVNGRLKGAHFELPYPSVGATETCLYLGVLAKGRTVISNAAIEPEIMELITMLRSMGARIFTSPYREIRIDGVDKLKGTRMEVLGDRIEAASWACLACASKGDITVRGIRPEILGNFLSYFQQSGGGVEFMGPSDIRFFRDGEIGSTVIETDVSPGFSTDWQQPFAILLTQGEGISIIHETVFEDRFGYLKSLNSLGARTQVSTQCLGGSKCRYRDRGYEHSAIIVGPTKLVSDRSLEITDLRAGLAYVISAAIAQGETELHGINFLERGYGDIVPRLSALNLQVERRIVTR